jgi:predicted N-acyltransferase
VTDPEFARAIAAFAARERTEVANTVDELERASPFKQLSDANRDELRPAEGR